MSDFKKAIPSLSKFKFLGFAHPGVDLPGFVSAVFSGPDQQKYIADTASNGINISKFTRVEIFDEDLVKQNRFAEYSENLPSDYIVGDECVFGFRSASGRIFVGGRKSLSVKLKRFFRQLNNYPFAQLEVAGFVNNASLLASAIRRSAVLEAPGQKSTTLEVFQDLAEECGLSQAFARQILVLDYGKALYTYYKIFHRLLHVSDPRMQAKLNAKFRVASDNIFPFLIDGSIFELIVEQDELRVPTLEFAEISSASGYNQIASALKRFGVSGALVERYTDLISTKSEQQNFLPSVDDAVHAYEYIRNIGFRQKYKEYALERLEKKRWKKNVDDEFLGIIFGLTLVLSHELQMLSLERDAFADVRAKTAFALKRISNPL